MRNRWWRWLFICLLAFVPAAWLLLAGIRVIPGEEGASNYLGEQGILTSWEEQVHDWFYRWRGDVPSSLTVVYVDVDSQSIADLGNFPWDRGWFAEVSGALVQEGGIKAVGIDFVFSTKGQPMVLRDRLVEGNQRFAEILRANRQIVLAASYTSAIFRDETGAVVVHQAPLLITKPVSEEDIKPPELPELTIGPEDPETGRAETYLPESVGLIDTLGGGVRWVPIYAPTAGGGRPLFHLSLELAARVLGVPPEGMRVKDGAVELRNAEGDIVRRVPLTRGQLLEVNWYSAWDAGHNLHASFSDVLQYSHYLKDGNEDEKEAARKYFAQFKDFKDVVVLIGPVDPFLQDIAPTPLDTRPVPRVGIHGNLVKTIVEGSFIRRPPFWVVALMTIVLTGLVTWLATADGRYSRPLKLVAFVVVVGYFVAAALLFSGQNYHLPIVAPVGAALSTSFFAVLAQLVYEQQQKGRIRSMFSTYAPEQIVDRLIESGEQPRLGGVSAEITAYFSDIQGFSTFAEQLPPERLVELMNEYLTHCTEIVYEELGLLDKYVGDAVVAMFGGLVAVPDHSRRACLAAIKVQERQRKLCEQWASDGRNWPRLVLGMRTRIGLHAGPAIVGNIGSRQRFNYTMMGDTVNLAARLESACKHLGVYILVSQTVRHAADKAGGGIVFRRLDRVEVVGRAEPLEIHEVVGREGEVGDNTLRCLELFSAGRILYDERKWDEASELFRHAALLEPMQPGRDAGVAANPSTIFIKRCQMLKANPPTLDWDGVFRFTEK